MELQLNRPEAVAAGARSRLYVLLARAFRYPEDHSWDDLPQALQEVVPSLPYPLDVPPHLEAPRADDYIHAFEVGGPYGPPCFIYEGEYGGGRLKVMEDVLRFYDHFGLQPTQEEGRRDRPDHLATELEFMHVLTFQEAAALERGEDPTPYRQAQKEFLRHHLVDFVAAVASRLEAMGVPFYSQMARLAHHLCRQDSRHLEPSWEVK